MKFGNEAEFEQYLRGIIDDRICSHPNQVEVGGASSSLFLVIVREY